VLDLAGDLDQAAAQSVRQESRIARLFDRDNTA
jgi:hypothetical protein